MHKRHIVLMLKILVSGWLIWMLVDRIDLEVARDKILGAEAYYLWLAFLVTIAQIWICVIRWRAVLTAIDATLSFVEGLRIYLIGFFFNQALPSSVGGDAVRIYSTYKRGLPLSSAINGVMLERVATVLGLIILIVVTSPLLIDRVGGEETAWVVLSVSVLGAGGLAGLIILMFLNQLPSVISHWPLISGLGILAVDTRQVFLNPVNAVKALGWSLAGHANIALVVFLLGLSLNLQITFLDCMILMPPVMLIITLPISIAGWGVREGAMVAGLGLIGIPGEEALVLALMFGIVGVLMGVPGSIIWLMSSDKKVEAIDQIPAQKNN